MHYHVQLFATPWTIARQAPLSMGFSKQEYWSGLPFPIPGDLPYSGIEPTSPKLAGRFFTTVPPGKPKALVAIIKSNIFYVLPLTLFKATASSSLGIYITPMIILYSYLLSYIDDSFTPLS